MNDTARTPPGVPTGGQFTPTTHGEPSGVALLGDGLDDTETCRHCSADTSDGEGYDGYCGSCADLVSQHENGEHDGPADGDCPDCPDAVHVIDKLVILGDEQWRMDVEAKPRAGDTVLVKPVDGDEPTVRTVADVVSGPGAVVVVQLDDDPAGEPENVGGNEVTVLRPTA